MSVLEDAAAARRAARLRALHEAALTIAAPVPATPPAIATLLVAIVERAVATLSANDGWLVLQDDPAWRDLVAHTGAAEARATTVLLDHTGNLRRVKQRSDGATAHVLARGEFVGVDDTRAAHGFGPYPQLYGVGILSMAFTPLRASGRVLGLLGVTFRHAGTLAAEDREVLELFAAHAAAALDRIRHAAAAQQARLDGAMLVGRTMAHELNNALGVVVGSADLLAGRPMIAADGDVAADVALIIEAAERATAIVRRLQRIIRLEEVPSVLGPDRPLLDLDRSVAP